MEKNIVKNAKNKMVSMELSSVKIQQLNKQPIIESSFALSEDGNWVITKITTTDLKPRSYFEKVLGVKIEAEVE